MKRLFLFSMILMAALAARSQDLLCSWHFDALLLAPATTTVNPADSGLQNGVATIYLDGTNGSSVWITDTSGTGTELNAFTGSTINDGRVTPAATKALAPANSTANLKGLVIKFSMLNYENPVLTYATRNTSTGFQSQFFEYSTDGVSFTRFDTITGLTTTFVLKSIDLSAYDVLDNAANVYIRIIFDGASSETGNNRLDNITLNAAALPVADIIPPVVDTAFATSLSTVKVVFNEAVDNVTAETLTNYTGLAGIGTAVLNTGMDTVTLTLSTPLLDNVADTVCIANVEDTAGNVMAASQCFRLLFSTGDIIPPVVDTAWAENLSTVKVVFNEAMDDATAETTANYTGLPGIATAVLNTLKDTVTLTLSTPLTFGIPDTLIVNNVEDTAGNAMAAAQSFQVIFGVLDVTPPTVINAWPETHAIVKVKFSEAMDDVTAETVANYTGLAGIGSATLNTTMDTVTLALSINLINGIADTLYVQNVEDTAGNAMAAQQMFVLMLDTVTTPKALVITEIMYNPIEGPTDTTEFIEIYNNDVVSVDLINYTLTYNTNAFTFPTSVVLDPGEYALVSTNATAATAFYGMPFIQGNTTGVSNAGTVVKLKSPNGLLVDSLVYDDVAPWDTLADGDGYSLTLCDPDLDNTVAANWSLGTVLYGTSTYADPGQGCVTPTDTTAPVALHASLTNLTTAVVTFNEALDLTSAQTTSHYIGLGVVSAAVLTNDTVVTLTLSAPLQNAQTYILEVTGISDLASNVMTLTYEFPLMLDTTTSISEMTNTAIQIFPNPANDLINVTGTATASRIEMYNNMGMLVLSREADGNDSITIETSTLENGSYYINIRMNDGAVETKPIVIIK